MSIVVCPNCRLRVLPKSDGSCPSCHAILEKADQQPTSKTRDTIQAAAIKAHPHDELGNSKADSTRRQKLRLLVWFIILLAIIIALVGNANLKPFYPHFDYVELLGAVLGLSGAATIFYSFRSGVRRSVRGIITGTLFIFIGSGMLRPAFQSGHQKEVLNLVAAAVTDFEIRASQPPEELPAQIDSRERINEWVDILKTCQYHRPNHPRYEETYVVTLGYQTDTLRYRLGLDSTDPNTVDLQPFDLGTFLSIRTEFVLGTYRCDGLYDFLRRVLQ